MRARRPLNRQAVQEANERLWEDNPELNRRQLTMGTEDYEYRRQWMAAYQEALARQEQPPATSGGDGQVAAPSQPCPGATTADLGVNVTRTNDGRSLAGATVEISGPDSRTSTTDASGNVLFRGVNPGQYTVTGSKSNYSTETTTATVSAGATATAALALTADVELGVTVTDRSTNNAIQGATVRITGPEMHERRTDSSGIARFVGIATGDYRIQATHTHYRAGDTNVTVNQGSTPVQVQLTAVAGLGGTVRDRDTNDPIEGATVTLAERSDLSATTDASGAYNFSNVEAGTYHVQASKPGYTTATATVNVEARSSQRVNLQLQRITLEITDAANNPLTGTRTVIVGERIDLRVRTNPSGQAMTNIQWTIPGTTPGTQPASTVKSYTMALARTTKSDLTTGDLQSNSLQFYWVEGGNKDVRVSAQVGGATLQATVTFDVKRPTLDSFTSRTGPIDIGNPWGSGREMYCGTPADNGLNYTAEVTPPAGVNGEIKFTQTLQARLERTKTDGTLETWTIPGWWLDVNDPYANHGPHAVTAGVQRTIGDNDSPGMPLRTGYRRAEVRHMTFRLFVMFKPSGANTVWVPLGLLHWGWSGLAESSDGGVTWTKTSGAHQATNPSGSTTLEFAEWVDRKTDSPPHPTWV